MSDDRVTISVPEDHFEEAKAHKDDRTWGEILVDGAKSDGQSDEGQGEAHPTPLTVDDIPILRREIGDEVEDRMTRR